MGVPVLPNKGTWGNDANGYQVNQTNSVTAILALILGALQQMVIYLSTGGGGGSGGNVTVEGPIGAQTAAASVAVTQGAGANNLSTTQVATATTQVSLAIARPTRKSIVFENLDSAITIYVGPTGITSSTGYPIPFGQARVFTWTGQFFAVSASGTPLMAVSDEFD